MKKTLTTGLGGAALLALFVLAITYFSSCGSRTNSSGRIVVPISGPKDTSTNGSGTGFYPKVIITNPGQLPAGSLLIVECANKDCEGIAGPAGSVAAPRSPKTLFEIRIPYDLPANTEMSLRFRTASGAKE